MTKFRKQPKIKIKYNLYFKIHFDSSTHFEECLFRAPCLRDQEQKQQQGRLHSHGFQGRWGAGLTKDRPATPAKRGSDGTPGKSRARQGADEPKFKEASSWFPVSANNWRGRVLLEAPSETSHGGWAPPKRHATFSSLSSCVLWGAEGNPGHQPVLLTLGDKSNQVQGDNYVLGLC